MPKSVRSCSRCGTEHSRNHTYCQACIRQYNREWRERNPDYKETHKHKGDRRQETAAWRAANPEKYHAHYIVKNAIRAGALIRPEKCGQCGAPNPQAHHDNYALPLEVKWLCARCHGRLHEAMRAAA